MKVSMIEIRKQMRAELKARNEEHKKAMKKSAEAMGLGAKMEAAFIRAGFEPARYVSVYYGGGVSVSLSLEVESFKEDKRLNKALLLAMNVMGDDAKYRSNDYPSYSQREYRLDKSGVSVRIDANLKGEGSESCRRVKVGEEVQVVPKYEFRCN